MLKFKQLSQNALSFNDGHNKILHIFIIIQDRIFKIKSSAKMVAFATFLCYTFTCTKKGAMVI